MSDTTDTPQNPIKHVHPGIKNDQLRWALARYMAGNRHYSGRRAFGQAVSFTHFLQGTLQAGGLLALVRAEAQADLTGEPDYSFHGQEQARRLLRIDDDPDFPCDKCGRPALPGEIWCALHRAQEDARWTDEPDPVTSEYEHVKQQHADWPRPEAH